MNLFEFVRIRHEQHLKELELIASHHKNHQLWSVLYTLAKTTISCTKYIYQVHTNPIWNSSTPSITYYLCVSFV